jgi:uncharacterized protein (TIGR02265 family)
MADWIRQLCAPEAQQRPERLGKVSDAHWMRGMFFESTLEVVTRDLGSDAGTELRSKLSVLEYGQLKKFGLREFLTLQSTVAEMLARRSSFEEGVARTAGRAVETFFESIAGRTMKLLAGRDPHRLLGAAPNAYPLTANDGGERHYTRVDDKHALFAFRNDLLGPCHQYGVFKTAISLACDMDPSIVIKQTNPFDFDFEVSW